MRLKIENFQAISNAEVEFPVGITTITGPNSSGKSSILRSIALFAKNQGKKRHIKHKEKNFSITISLGDKSWGYKRGKSSGTYFSGDQVFEKIGTKTPHEYFEDFPILLDERGEVLQMSGEWDTLFPYDRTDTELFTLFEHVFNISDSSVILNYMKTDHKEKQQEIVRSTEEYNRLVPIVNTLEELELKKLADKCDSLSSKSQNASMQVIQESEVITCETVREKIKVKVPEPGVFNLEVLHIQDIENDLKTVDKLHNRYESCGKVESFEADFSHIDYIVSAKSDIELCNSIISKLECVPKVSQGDFNLDIDLSIFEDISSLDKLLQSYESVESELSSLKEQANTLNTELSSVEVCPLCGSNIKHQH